MASDTAARRNGGYESGDGPLPDPELLPTGPAPGAQKATATAARRPDPETWGGCPLALCYFTEEGVCRTHPDGCPEHDCQWCQPDFSDYGGTHGFGY